MRGWKGNGRQTTVTTYRAPHPWSVLALTMDRLFAADYAAESSMDRREIDSAVNGSRFMGDLGPLQTFEQVAAPSLNHIPVQPSHLPGTSGTPSTGNPILDLIANTSG